MKSMLALMLIGIAAGGCCCQQNHSAQAARLQQLEQRLTQLEQKVEDLHAIKFAPLNGQ